MIDGKSRRRSPVIKLIWAAVIAAITAAGAGYIWSSHDEPDFSGVVKFIQDHDWILWGFAFVACAITWNVGRKIWTIMKEGPAARALLLRDVLEFFSLTCWASGAGLLCIAALQAIVLAPDSVSFGEGPYDFYILFFGWIGIGDIIVGSLLWPWYRYKKYR